MRPGPLQAAATSRAFDIFGSRSILRTSYAASRRFPAHPCKTAQNAQNGGGDSAFKLAATVDRRVSTTNSSPWTIRNQSSWPHRLSRRRLPVLFPSHGPMNSPDDPLLQLTSAFEQRILRNDFSHGPIAHIRFGQFALSGQALLKADCSLRRAESNTGRSEKVRRKRDGGR